MSDPAPPDVAELVRDIQAEVARRRAAGEYPADLLVRLHREFSLDAVSEPLELLGHVQTARPVTSGRRGQRLIVNGKRALRRSIAWYVQPIVHDQIRFNQALVREIRNLERRLVRLETPWSGAGELGRSGTAGKALEAARAAILATLLREAPPGPVHVLGAGEHLLNAIAERGVARLVRPPQPSAAAARPPADLDRLEATPAGSLAAIVLAGVLPRLAATELLAVIPVAARTLVAGGLLVVDAPDPRHEPRPADPGMIDATMRRWIGPDTVGLLCEAAGAPVEQLVPITPQALAHPWYAAVARRSDAGDPRSAG